MSKTIYYFLTIYFEKYLYGFIASHKQKYFFLLGVADTIYDKN